MIECRSTAGVMAKLTGGGGGGSTSPTPKGGEAAFSRDAHLPVTEGLRWSADTSGASGVSGSTVGTCWGFSALGRSHMEPASLDSAPGLVAISPATSLTASQSSSSTWRSGVRNLMVAFGCHVTRQKSLVSFSPKMLDSTLKRPDCPRWHRRVQGEPPWGHQAPPVPG